MGYTHYMRQKPELSQKKFTEFAEYVEQLLSTDEAKKLLAYEYNQPCEPVMITDQVVWFNGKGKEGHETLVISRKAEASGSVSGKAFSFCKTALKPYDKYVTACYLLAKIVFEKDVTISSDGGIEDWQAGKELVEGLLNSTLTITENQEGRFQVEVVSKETTPEEFIADITA